MSTSVRADGGVVDPRVWNDAQEALNEATVDLIIEGSQQSGELALTNIVDVGFEINESSTPNCGNAAESPWTSALSMV